MSRQSSPPDTSRRPEGQQANVTVGILGGMGPLATVDFYRKVVRDTPASTDQEHFPVVIWADPSVPDRTQGLIGGGPDPTPWLIYGAQRLEAMGADLIATPCNTAHAFLPRVRESVSIPILDMIVATVNHICHLSPAVAAVGVLASEGTVQARLYHRQLEEAGLRVLVPDQASQKAQVNASIRMVKAGNIGPETRGLIAASARSLAHRGAELVIAACTEFPLILDEAGATVPVMDPTSVLARAVINRAHTMRGLAAP